MVKFKNNKLSRITLILIITIFIFAAILLGIWFYEKGKFSITPSPLPVTSPPASEVKYVEYKSPYGYSFSYPNNFRFAHQYINFWTSLGSKTLIDIKDSVIVLTAASQEEEDRYLQNIRTKAIQQGIDLNSMSGALFVFEHPDFLSPFYPEKTIEISLSPIIYSIDKLKRSQDKQLQEKIRQKFGYLPSEISEVEEIISKDGTKGVIYKEVVSLKKNYQRWYINAYFPLKRPGVFKINPLDDTKAESVLIQISADSPANLKTIHRQIISTFEFF